MMPGAKVEPVVSAAPEQPRSADVRTRPKRGTASPVPVVEKEPAMSNTFQNLPTVRLGRTDMDVTRVGFGSWAVGGDDWAVGWGHQEDTDSIAAIRHAVRVGVNWIDTAAVYGLGHSEEVVAEALAEIAPSERPLVFTKCGLTWGEDRAASPNRVGTAASLRRELEQSLQRLRIERIDLYQMHRTPTDGTALDEYWGTLLAMKREGKVRAVGLSNHGMAQLDTAERLGHVDTLQPPFSAIRRGVATAELPWCHEHGTGVIVYNPMQAGLLTGAFTAERSAALPKDDWRSRSPDFTGDGLARNLQVAAALRPVAEKHGVSQAAASVAWTLAWPGVTGAIVGARTAEQVDGWVAAGALTLDADDMAALGQVIAASGAGEGPAVPG